jgi:flagellar hook assembly protein FlgD
VSFSSKLLRVVQARVYPNPASGPATLEFYLAGEASQAGLSADASLFDAQGRRVRNLFRGTLPRGMTSMQWDGLDERGRTLGPGLYFLRFSTPAGNSITRVMRSR